VHAEKAIAAPPRLPPPAAASPVKTLGLRRGDEVEVRGLAEIRATLDARGTLDGIPFMAEMERFAGRPARVRRRADRVCVEGAPTMRRLDDAVFLEDLRCDGSAHAGCKRACLLLWKEAWLRLPDAGSPAAPPPAPSPSDAGAFPPESGERFFCQSTALFAASTPLPSWAPGQYLRDLFTGNLTPVELLRSFAATVGCKVEPLLARRTRRARPPRTPSESLGLAAGEWVVVKSLAEIETTLDAGQRNRGLDFAPGMENYCGRRFRVAQRVERIILEATGEMREVADTVLLEDVFCDGFCSRGCPRANTLYWREIWLRRAP
jgi:hypothetical protein